MATASAITIGAALADGAARLGAAGIDSARLDARLLLASATGKTAEQIVAHPEQALSSREADAFAALIERRVGREPVAQLVGHREFWSLDFATTRDTLTPRPDTETIIETALGLFPDRGARLRVLDLGTGTGCLLVALLNEYRAATGVGSDASAAAADVARRNVAAHALQDRAAIKVGNWDDAIDGRFDLIVSNPPYIATAELARLEPEVAQFEPHLALDGGADGLDAYRALAPRVANRLAEGGFAVLEIGLGQASDAADLCVSAGLQVHGRACDLAGRERCVVLKR
jgi:release factor glutamine methyltransferase